MKRKLNKILQFIINPKLLLCIGIAWLITNGWSYVLLALGTYLKIKWMISIAGGYIAFLWLPFTPEKIVTIAISIVLLKTLFPNDKKTLVVLERISKRIKLKSQ